MELKQLDAYVKVYELQSFSKAANAMFISQPSISAYISSLEKELQTILLHRYAKELMPTKSGALFYEYAKEILALRDKALAGLAGFSGLTAGSIDILASSVPAQYILPEVLGAFHKLHPGITFKMEQADTQEVVSGILLHKAEVGFVGAKIDDPKCICEQFMSEKLILIAPCEPRFREKDTVDISALLRDEYFVVRGSGSGTRLKYEDFLSKIGHSPAQLKVSAHLGNTHSIIQAVSSGLGLSFVSELAAAQFIRQGLVLPLNIGQCPQRSFYTLLKRDCPATPAAAAFVEFARSYTLSRGAEPTKT